MELETLEGILKVGGIVITAAVIGNVVLIGEIYYINKFLESDRGDQIISYGLDLIKYQRGELQKIPKFSDYEIQKTNLK